MPIQFPELRARHRRFLLGSKGRHGTAALASVTVILIIVILPFAILAGAITDEAFVSWPASKIRFAIASQMLPRFVGPVSQGPSLAKRRPCPRPPPVSAYRN
mgnify:CR=1 FL=1